MLWRPNAVRLVRPLAVVRQFGFGPDIFMNCDPVKETIMIEAINAAINRNRNAWRNTNDRYGKLAMIFIGPWRCCFWDSTVPSTFVIGLRREKLHQLDHAEPTCPRVTMAVLWHSGSRTNFGTSSRGTCRVPGLNTWRVAAYTWHSMPR